MPRKNTIDSHYIYNFDNNHFGILAEDTVHTVFSHLKPPIIDHTDGLGLGSTIMIPGVVYPTPAINFQCNQDLNESGSENITPTSLINELQIVTNVIKTPSDDNLSI